jgi:hypothetical protein
VCVHEYSKRNGSRADRMLADALMKVQLLRGAGVMRRRGNRAFMIARSPARSTTANP